MRKNYWLGKNPEVEGSCGFRNQEIAGANMQQSEGGTKTGEE